MQDILTHVELVTRYYLIDWASVLLGLLGTFLISEKLRAGFMLMLIGVLCGAGVAIMAETYAFLFYNLAAAAINLRGYAKWRVEDMRPPGAA